MTKKNIFYCFVHNKVQEKVLYKVEHRKILQILNIFSFAKVRNEQKTDLFWSQKSVMKWNPNFSETLCNFHLLFIVWLILLIVLVAFKTVQCSWTLKNVYKSRDIYFLYLSLTTSSFQRVSCCRKIFDNPYLI